MPSPFPGMDPYLEQRLLWRAFHNKLAVELATVLNACLPDSLVADVEEEYETVEIANRNEAGVTARSFYADVGIVEESGEAVVETTTATVDAVGTGAADTSGVETVWEPASAKRLRVRVLDSERRESLVTVIEILSPSNKRPGRERSRYLLKKELLIESSASLVEIDLLLGGKRATASDADADRVFATDATTPYVVATYPSWRRVPEIRSTCYPIRLDQPLPRVSVPLQLGDAVTVDLQAAFSRLYDASRYGSRIDYDEPPPVPLSPELREQAVPYLTAAARAALPVP